MRRFAEEGVAASVKSAMTTFAEATTSEFKSAGPKCYEAAVESSVTATLAAFGKIDILVTQCRDTDRPSFGRISLHRMEEDAGHPS